MHKSKLVKLAVLLIGLSLALGVGAAETKKIAKSPQVVKAEKAIADADAARKKAASVKGEWRDTGKLIKAAQKALDNGDVAKAIQLAEQARNQGELGYQQAMAQQKLRLPAYLKY